LKALICFLLTQSPVLTPTNPAANWVALPMD